MNRFIQVNGAILDFSEYVKEAALAKSRLFSRLMECASEEDFIVEIAENNSYSNAKLSLYNKRKDIEIVFEMRKRSTEDFV